MTNEPTPTEAQPPEMSIETMRVLLKTSSYLTPGHQEAEEGLELCAKELPMNDADYARAFVVRNRLIEKRVQVAHLVQREVAEQAELDVMDTIIDMLHGQTAATRVMKPQIATLRMVTTTLEK